MYNVSMLAEPTIQQGGQRLRMTYEQFAAWADEDVHAEWVDGEVIVFPMAKSVHQVLVYFLAHLLGLHFGVTKQGALRLAPFEMKIPGGRAYREPDILVVKQENMMRLNEDRLEGPADLVIEIVSNDSVYRDRDEKFKEYEAAGIPEYWIIDPRPSKHRADFFKLDENGKYVLFGTEDDAQLASHILPGFWLDPAWLWTADTLNPLHCFAIMRGIDPALVDQLFGGQ